MKLLAIFPLLFFLGVSNGYRILGFFPFPGKSHFMMFEHLLKGLAKKGHQVDVMSSFPLKKPYENYKDIASFKIQREFVNNFSYVDMNNLLGTLPVYTVSTLVGNELCHLLGHPSVQKILKEPPKDPPYDVVLMEIFGANCFMAIAHVLQVPAIGASSAVLYPWSNDLIANPENLAFVPNNLLGYDENMNFSERLYNVVHTLFNKLYFNYLTSEQDEIIKKYVGPGIPPIRELERNVSIILSNSHLSMNGIRPTTPALIEVGGLHVVEEGVELPASLEKWMNESTAGFIYFTFGSMITIESFPPHYLEIFYNSLGKIAPVRVLMKIANPSELPPGLPKNIHTLPWMPQIKVLKHRNIKAFVTHGGLMGTQEAIYCGVPLIGIPLFADQFINVDTYARKNFAIKLDITTLTEEKMDKALNAILNDPIYRDTAKKISEIFLDRPMSPVDTANYWVEYVIKHGANAVRSPAMNLTWWQIQLLDVYACLILIVSIAVAILAIVAKFVMDFFYPKSTSYNVSRAKKVT